jgi:hypothetical protein
MGNQFLGNLQQHVLHVAEEAFRDQISFPKALLAVSLQAGNGSPNGHNASLDVLLISK